MAQGDFRKLNNPFVCKNCGKDVLPAKRTSRNHCPFCLYSMHVDIFPGDRKELCHGLMEPIDYEYQNSQFVIIHKCTKCGKVGKNKAASDDNIEQLLSVKITG